MPSSGDMDDDNISIAHSDLQSERSSKPVPPPVQRAASQRSTGGGDASIAMDDDDGNASIAFSDAASERPQPKAPSLRPSTAGGSAKPAGGSRAPSLSGLLRDEASNASVSYSEAASEKPVKPAKQAPPSTSGMSFDVSHDEDGNTTPRPPVKRESSSTSSRPAKAPSVKGDADNPSGDMSFSYSAVGDDAGDDAASTKSSASKRRSQAPVPAPSAPSVSGLSMRSSTSSRPGGSKPASAANPPAPRSSTGYSESGLGDDLEVDHGQGREAEEAEAKASASLSMSGAISTSAKEQRRSSAGGRDTPQRAPSRTASISKSSTHGGYGDEDFEDDAASSVRAAPPSKPAAKPSPARSSASSIIDQHRHSSGGDTTPTSKPSKAKQAPADSPLESPTAPATLPRPLSRSASIQHSHDGGSEGGHGGWNEGAVHVAQLGAPRPSSARRTGQPSRPERPASAASNVDGAGSGGGYLGRQRPLSAAPRDRQSAQLQALTRKHPATWEALDVALWIEFLGLGQYRKRFMHHAVDGRLLLRLKDAQLKTELGIGVLGHRTAILDAAAQLIRNYEEGQRDRIRGGDEVENELAANRQGAPGRMRPSSAIQPPSGSLSKDVPRRPASASRSVIPPDPYLGPAQGKQTVYEQRARLLFELDRAQARAEQHRALAAQLSHTANLSADEVAHLRGMLQDIEAKNRSVFGFTNAMDKAGRIPWRHVGKGSRLGNWDAHRFGRPGDPETVDLTFQPRINPESRRLLSEGRGEGGSNGFLDRLDNDLRKRQSTKQELERKYYAADAHRAGMAQEKADWAIVSEQLQSRCHIGIGQEASEYEEQIDDALDKLSTGESWREAHLQDAPIRAAKGSAKLAAMAGALRSLAFLERYKSDLKTKDSRAKQLEKKWLNQTLGAQYLPGAKDKEDLDQAVQFFALLGWRDDSMEPSEEAVTDDQLDRLLDRAIEYRTRYDAWWERVRDKPEERSAGFRCDVDWNRDSKWASDGLARLMEAEMSRQGGAGGEAPAAGAPPVIDFVEFTVRLLGKCRMDDLRRTQQLNGRVKRLAVYRAIRTQKFIEFTEKDLQERDRKMRQAYSALAPPKRVLESNRIEGFFDRLMEDAAKRRAKAEKLAHEKVAKEQEILTSSVMYNRSKK